MEMLAQGAPEKAVQDAIDAAPEVMAALVRQFIEKKDVDCRVQVKMRMKALLDFLSVDTTFPPNPLPDSKVSPAREAAMAPYGIVGGDQGVVQPGQAHRLNNADIV